VGLELDPDAAGVPEHLGDGFVETEHEAALPAAGALREVMQAAAEARLLRHDEHLERRARLQAVHEASEARTLQELRPRDAVIAVHVLVGDRPALARGVGLRNALPAA
jgi:hypothetical protein